MRDLTIAGRRIADDTPPYVLCEIGNNHQGSVQTAWEMIAMAADCGAAGVKFQKRDTPTLYSPALLAKAYDNPASFGATYGEHRAALELPASQYGTLRAVAHARDLGFVATAFDERSAEAIAGVVDAFKIASGGLTDLDLIRHVAGYQKPVILSTGGGTWREADRAYDCLMRSGTAFALLHCTAAYPCAFEDLNLRCILSMRERYPETLIGWSCHVHNLSMVMQAQALGARLLECHVTLNRAMKGTDHAFSFEPATLRKLCKDLQRGHVAQGDGEKRYLPCEVAPVAKMRRRLTPDGLQITGALDAVD